MNIRMRSLFYGMAQERRLNVSCLNNMLMSIWTLFNIWIDENRRMSNGF